MARKHNFAFAAVALLLVPAVAGARRNRLQMQTDKLVGTWAVVNPRFGSSWSVEFDSVGSYIASPIPRVSWPYRIEGDHFEISLEEKHGKPLWNRQLLHVTNEQKVEISDPSCGVSVQMNRLIELSHDPGGIEGMWRLEELTDEGILKCKGLLPFIGFSTAEFSHDGTVILGATPHCAFRGLYKLSEGLTMAPHGEKPFDSKADLKQGILKLRIRSGWPRFAFRKIEGSENISLIRATAKGDLRSCDVPIALPVGTPPWPGPY